MFSVGSFIIQGRGSTFTDSINHKDPCSTNVVFIEKNFAYQWTCTVQTYVILGIIIFNWISLLAQMVKKLPAMQETLVSSLGWEDPLEKGMATHSNILVRRISWTEGPSGLQSMGLQRVGCD